jgi:hypothetical protein
MMIKLVLATLVLLLSLLAATLHGVNKGRVKSQMLTSVFSEHKPPLLATLWCTYRA